MKDLFAELKRRRVIRVAIVYAAAAFVLLQAADLLLPALLLPDWTYRLFVALALLGFPVAVALAWAFDITPEGVKRTEPAPRAAGAPRAPASRAAGWAGVGILIGIVGFGAYAYLGGGEYRDGNADAGAARAIAVLPFQNLSADAENEYFADGITEDVLSQLALVPGFAVISRTSVMRYKGSEKSVPEIARELGVDYVLEGSVRRAGQDVRIVAQLIDARSDEHLWAATYDRRLEHIFAVQTEIAQAISGALRARLTRGVEARLERTPTDDIEAYDLFLFGREQFYRYDRPGVERAIASFREALRRDSEFALAQAWLGRAFAIYANNIGAGAEYADSAIAAASRAVEMQPDLGDAHTALGTAYLSADRLAAATAAFERALTLNPNDWVATGNLGVTYALAGRLDEAIRLALASLRREPARSIIAYGNLASWYAILGLRGRAHDAVARAYALSPDYPGAINAHAWLHLLEGDTAAAVAAAERMVSVAGDQASTLFQAAHVLVAVGRYQRARELLARTYELSPTATLVSAVAADYGYLLWREGRQSRAEELFREFERFAAARVAQGDQSSALRYALAVIHATRGEIEAALTQFEEAIELGAWQIETIRRDPGLDPLRAEPRFLAALRRLEERAAAQRARVEREAW